MTIEDQSGNVVRSANDDVTIALGANPGGATLLGPITAHAVNGSALFQDLQIQKAGRGYTLTASSGTLTSATSASFAIAPSVPLRLAFVVQPPSSTQQTRVLTPAIQVAVQDVYGNTVTSAANAVTLSLRPNLSGGKVAGTTTVGPVNGVATFTDLHVDQPGSGYTLVAASDPLIPTMSAAFEIRTTFETMAVTPQTAVIHAAAVIPITVVIGNDTSNRGARWAVTCAVAPCGTVSAATTASGTATMYEAPGAFGSNAGPISITATAIADSLATASTTLIPVGQIPGYDAGVDYHAYGTDMASTAFITIYHQPAVREIVRGQLQGMADRGATFVQTMIWFVTPAESAGNGETWRATFPMSDQEATNLRAYAQDVAAVQGTNGNRLRLNIVFAWLGAADYTMGTPGSGLGWYKLTDADFISRVATTTDKVLAAVKDVTRPDGVPVVHTIYLKAEVTIPAPGEPNGNPNEGWFLTTNYPRFVSVVAAAGLQPSVYFSADGRQEVVLDNAFVDSYYAILNGHRSMFWIYRGLKFMVDHGLPVPPRIDFSCYLIPTTGTVGTGALYNQLLQRILDDADAVLPSLGAPRLYGAAETYYLVDSTQRMLYSQAFVSQAASSSRMQRVSFWTTPDGGAPGQNVAYPFAIEAFLPRPQ